MTSTKPFFMSPWGCRELPLGIYCIVGMPGGICKKYSETFVKENLDAMWKNCACVFRYDKKHHENLGFWTMHHNIFSLIQATHCSVDVGIPQLIGIPGSLRGKSCESLIIQTFSPLQLLLYAFSTTWVNIIRWFVHQIESKWNDVAQKPIKVYPHQGDLINFVSPLLT